MICQRTTKGVIYIYTQAGFSADVYLDDFYGTECTSLADNTFATLESIFETLGLSLFAFAFDMVCLGILVNTKDFTLHVPEPRLHEFDYLPSENCNLCSVNFPL